MSPLVAPAGARICQDPRCSAGLRHSRVQFARAVAPGAAATVPAVHGWQSGRGAAALPPALQKPVPQGAQSAPPVPRGQGVCGARFTAAAGAPGARRGRARRSLGPVCAYARALGRRAAARVRGAGAPRRGARAARGRGRSPEQLASAIAGVAVVVKPAGLRKASQGAGA